MYRQQLIEVYPNDNEDALKKIGYVSQPIKIKNETISFCYGLAFYAKVEQLFINYLTSEMEDLISFLQGQLRNQLPLLERESVSGILKWLKRILDFMIGEEILQKDNFISFYNDAFYQTVFKEFNQNNQIQHTEEFLGLVSSMVLQKYMDEYEPSSTSLDQLRQHLFGGDVTALSDGKIFGLCEVYQMAIRAYLDCNDQLDIMSKYGREVRFRNSNQSLMFIYDCEANSFRLGYDQTLSSTYSHFNYKKESQKQLEKDTDMLTAALDQNLQGIKENLGQKIKNAEKLAEALEEENGKSGAKMWEINTQLEMGKQEYNQEYATWDNLTQQYNHLIAQQQNAMMYQQEYEVFNQQQQQLQKYMKQQEESLKKQQLAYEQLKILEFQSQQTKMVQQQQQKPSQRQYSDIGQSMAGNKGFSIGQSFIGGHSVINYKLEEKRQCTICFDDFKTSVMIYFKCCGSYFDRDCIQSHFEASSETEKRFLTCPNFSCKKPVENYISLFNIGVISLKVQNNMKMQLNMACFNCKHQFTHKNSGAAVVSCPKCQRKICPGCQEPAHQKGDKACKERVANYEAAINIHHTQIEEQITAMQDRINANPNNQQLIDSLNELRQEKRFRICPFCTTLLFKDQHCEHVTCLECKNILCFTCGCEREPTLGHDNSFHRDKCPYADKINLNDPPKLNNKCKKCVATGVVCQYPTTWQQYQDYIAETLGDELIIKFPENWRVLK